MKIDDNNNNNSGNNGNKGKFSERLKKIRRDRLTKIKDINDESDVTLKDAGRNIIKVILSLPLVVYTHVTDSDKIKDNNKNEKVSRNENSIDYNVITSSDFTDVSTKNKTYNESKKIRVSKIKEIDISLLKKQKQQILKKHKLVDIYKRKDKVNLASDEITRVKLQKEIIDLIKKKLVNNINELEMLQSEFYVLNELGIGDIYLSKCQDDIKEIKKLLSKIKSLKEKYDYLKDNVDFEYMLEYGDDLLIDKILELKEICSKDDLRHTVDDYKILDEYKYLYLKIDKLQEDMFKLEDYKNKKVQELKQRDIDFDKLKNDVYDFDREKERYDRFVETQELILRELDEKILKIDSHEMVTYKLKGFDQLLSNSFKYLGLLLVNPLKGLIPGIVTQTLVTKNVIRNLYDNLEWEEHRKMVYDTIDYSNSINMAINNLDDTALLVDSTLKELVELKSKYKKKFGAYEKTFSSYKDAIKKINKIENAVLGSKIKIEHMRKKMKEKEKQNNSKLKMVKKLNNSDN